MSYGDALNEQEKYNEAIDIYNEGIEKTRYNPKIQLHCFGFII